MRKYKITPLDNWFKVQVWNEYGHYNCVYERNVLDASKHIMDWWNQAEECKKTKDKMSKALEWCFNKENKQYEEYE